MLRLLSILYLVLIIGCKSNYSDYYYGERSFRTFLCSWKHYIVVEDKGDILQVWNLDDECNAGYWSTGNTTIPKREGVYGNLNLTKITDREIRLSYDRGYENINFTLNRKQIKYEAFKVINITQMLSIDNALEQYVQVEAKNAENNTLYLTEKYIADEKAGLLDPTEFRNYYKAKKEKVAETVIKELSTK